jgi:hypothetical protein
MGTFRVLATGLNDAAYFGSASVTVPELSVVLSPSSVTLGPGGRYEFLSLSDAGLLNPFVQWSIQEESSGGTITAGGLLTAPTSAGTYHVVAISLMDQTVRAVAVVTVVRTGFSTIDSPISVGGEATATALPDGRILIAGGSCSTCNADFVVGKEDAELYDPASESTTPTGHMNTARFGHTATLLNNGKILIAGGFVDIDSNGFGFEDYAASTKTAELYDSSTGLFSPTGDMNTSRGAHTATLLADGRVLITGGGTGQIGGGYSHYGTAVRSSEIYDPATGTFSPTGDMLYPRYLQSATALPNGKVLVHSSSNTLGTPFAVEKRDETPDQLPNAAWTILSNTTGVGLPLRLTSQSARTKGTARSATREG